MDNEFSELLIRDWITRFVQRAQSILDVPDWVPPSIRPFLADMEATPKNEMILKQAKHAKAVATGAETPSGNDVAALLDLCSDKFRDLHRSELSAPDQMPTKWKPFVEYAAALEIVREHRAYVRRHFKWLGSLGEFLGWLENPEFVGFQEKIEGLVSFFDPNELREKKKREANRERKQRQRERERREK